MGRCDGALCQDQRFRPSLRQTPPWPTPNSDINASLTINGALTLPHHVHHVSSLWTWSRWHGGHPR